MEATQITGTGRAQPRVSESSLIDRPRWTSTTQRDIIYMAGVLIRSMAAWVGWTVSLSLSASVLVLTLGTCVWLPGASLRSLVDLDRRLLSRYLGRPVPARERPSDDEEASRPGRAKGHDRRSWGELRWLMLNSTLGMLSASIGIGAILEVIALVSTPLWWWALSNPHHQYGTLNLGLYTVTSTGWAFVTTALGLALAPIALAINHGLAHAHAELALSRLD